MKRLLPILLITLTISGLVQAKAMIESINANLCQLLTTGQCTGCDLTGLQYSDLLPSSLQNQCYQTGSVAKITNLTGANLTSAQLQAPTGQPPINLSGVNLTGANLSGANLTGIIATGKTTLFNNASLYSANLTNANFSGANFNGAGLGGANLSGTNFTGAILLNLETTMSEENENGAATNTLIGINTALNVNKAIFTNAFMAGINLNGANMSGVKMDGADLSFAHLLQTDFTGANLTCASIMETDLSSTIMPNNPYGLNLTHTIYANNSNVNSNPNGIDAYFIRTSQSTYTGNGANNVWIQDMQNLINYLSGTGPVIDYTQSNNYPDQEEIETGLTQGQLANIAQGRTAMEGGPNSSGKMILVKCVQTIEPSSNTAPPWAVRWFTNLVNNPMWPIKLQSNYWWLPQTPLYKGSITQWIAQNGKSN
jgi:uncharacterized protein YjbI with pentapeptide repeats